MNNIIMENTTIKKKRGRKPKNKEIINENPVFDNQNTTDVIVKLNLNNEMNNNIELGNDKFNNNNYSLLEDINTSLCWNCSKQLLNLKIGLPLKYINDVFITYGNFCSFECSGKYCFDNYDNEKYEIYSLLNLYYNQMYDTTNQVVNIAKDKIHLDVFGGNLTYEEYSKDFCKLEDANENIHVKELIDNFENVNTLHNISKLKLYRNIKSKNNLSTIMNLDAYDK